MVRLKVHTLKQGYVPLMLPVTEQGNKGAEAIKSAPSAGDGYQFEFPLDKGFQYRFGLTDEDGLNLIESRVRQVLVKPDLAPNVSVDTQGLQLELRDQDSLPIKWRACLLYTSPSPRDS